MRLTKNSIERAKLPQPGKKESFLRDDVVRGLGVRITANGTRRFIFEAWIDGRSRRFTIGKWPDINVVVARQRALDIRTRIAHGQDPASDAKTARKETTFGQLSELYLERYARPHKRSWRRDEANLQLHVPAGWNNRRLSTIGRNEVAQLHARIGATDGQVAANRVLALLSTMFNLARNWELSKGENPVIGIRKFKERKRERYLTPDEVERVKAAILNELDWRWRAYFPLALMLGTRKSELLSMRWTDINLTERAWRIPETKRGNSHLLPLPAPAMDILESLRSRGESEFVFPGTGASGHIQEPKKAWARIRERAAVPNVRIHDLRHTLASWMVAAGFNLPIVGRALNHTQLSTTNRYAHLDLDAVRVALEVTATALMSKPAVTTADK